MVAKLDDYLRFNETALNLRAQRQQLLASNIANADTPNYKARDIDFAKTLEGAMANKSTAAGAKGVAMERTDIAHLAGKDNADQGIGGSPLLYRTPSQGSVDGNTVDMDVERTQFADNGIRYEAGITAINGQLKALLAAIQPG